MKSRKGKRSAMGEAERNEFRETMRPILRDIPAEFYPLILAAAKTCAARLEAEDAKRKQRIKTERAGKIRGLPSRPILKGDFKL